MSSREGVSQTLLTQLHGLEEETRLARERFQKTLDDIAASEEGGLAGAALRRTPGERGGGEERASTGTPSDADVDRLLRRLDKLERPVHSSSPSSSSSSSSSVSSPSLLSSSSSSSSSSSAPSNAASSSNGALSNTFSEIGLSAARDEATADARAQAHLDDLSRAQAHLDSLTRNGYGGEVSTPAAPAAAANGRATSHPLGWMGSLVSKSGSPPAPENVALQPAHLAELEHTIDHEHAELSNERDWLRREIEREQQRMDALRATQDAQHARLDLPAESGALASPLPLQPSSSSSSSSSFQADMDTTDFLDRWRQRKDDDHDDAPPPIYLQPPSPSHEPPEDRTTDVLRKAEAAMQRAEKAMISFTHHGGKAGVDPLDDNQGKTISADTTTVIPPELAGAAVGDMNIIVNGETIHADDLAGRYEEVSSMARQVSERAQKIVAGEKKSHGASRKNKKKAKRAKKGKKKKKKKKKRTKGRRRGRSTRRGRTESGASSSSSTSESSESSSSSSVTDSSDYSSSSSYATDEEWADSKVDNETQRTTRSLFGRNGSKKEDRHHRHRRHRHRRRRHHRSYSDDSRSKRATRRGRRKKKRGKKRGRRSDSEGSNSDRHQQTSREKDTGAPASIQDFRTLEQFLASARSEEEKAASASGGAAAGLAVKGSNKQDVSNAEPAGKLNKSHARGHSMFTRIIMGKYKSQAVAIEKQREKAQAAKRSKDLQSLRKRASEKARMRRRRKDACLRVQMWWRCVSARKQLARRKERRRRAEVETARRRVEMFQQVSTTSSRGYSQASMQIPSAVPGGQVPPEHSYQPGVGNTNGVGVGNYQRVFSPEQVLQAFGAGAPRQQTQYPQAQSSARVLEYSSTGGRAFHPQGTAAVAPRMQHMQNQQPQQQQQQQQQRQPPPHHIYHMDRSGHSQQSPPPPAPPGAPYSDPLPAPTTPQLSPPPAPTLTLPSKTSPGSGRKTRRQLSILRLGALVLGFRVRLFMKSPKVQTIIRQIRDTAFVVKDMPHDALREKTVSQLVSLKKQLCLLFHPKDGRPFGVVFAEEMNRVNRAKLARLNSKSRNAGLNADGSSSSSSSSSSDDAAASAAAAAKKNEAKLKRGAAARERTKAYQKKLKEERQKKLARKNRKKTGDAGLDASAAAAPLPTSSSQGGNLDSTASLPGSAADSAIETSGTNFNMAGVASKQDGSDDWWFAEGGLGIAPAANAGEASCIVVQIMAARELYGVPRAPEPQGMRDPFASLEMTYEDADRGIVKTIHSKGANKTMVCSGTLDPRWHMDIALALPSSSSLPEEERALMLERLFLMLRVEDNDRFNNQKLLGCLRLPLADLPGGVRVGAAWYPLTRGKDAGKLCVRGDVQIRVKLVKSTGSDSRISRAKRIMNPQPAATAALPPPGPPRSPPRGEANRAAQQQRDPRKGPTQKRTKKKKKKRVISYKADYSHVKSKTDCYNEMAYPVAEEVNYARERQHPRHVNEEDDFSVSYRHKSVIGESVFPMSTHIDLSMDDSAASRSPPSSRGGGEWRRQRQQQQQQQRRPVEERSPPLDTSTLMKMYYHGESTLSALPAGRLQLDDLERLQSQLESRDHSGQSAREDPMSILPRLSAQRDMDVASYDAQVERLEREYSRLGGAGI